MNKLDKLLNYIEEGNEEKILEEKELTKAFNKLCKYGLIEITEKGIYLTEDGLKAKKEGAAKIIREKENEKYTADFSPNKIEKKKLPVTISLALLILLFLFFFILTV